MAAAACALRCTEAAGPLGDDCCLGARQFNAMNNYENIRIYNAFVGEEARA